MDYAKLNSLIDGKKTTKSMVVRKTGISRPTLDSILGGNDFKVSNLEKIAKALNVSVSTFFEEQNIDIRNSGGGDYYENGGNHSKHFGPEYHGSCVDPKSELELENSRLKDELIKIKDELLNIYRKNNL